MSLTSDVTLHVTRGFPRVSGDEPDGDTLDLASILFSPRERG